MDASQVRAIVDKYAPALMQKLGVQHWSIVFYYDLQGSKGDFSKKGECTRQVDYLRATIAFDPAELATEDEVVKVLQHELIHVVLAPFDVLWNTACEYWPGDTAQSRVMDSIWDHVVEQAVLCIERVCEGHGPTELVAAVPPPKPKRK